MGKKNKQKINTGAKGKPSKVGIKGNSKIKDKVFKKKGSLKMKGKSKMKGNLKMKGKSKMKDVVSVKEKPSAIVKPSTKGLSVVEKCKLRMATSQLRMTDEDLYTKEANEADLKEQDFITYHDAYELAASKWPVKPIQYIMEYLKSKKCFANLNKLTFADIGCGRLPLVKLGLPEGTRVHSFDLISTHPDITQANMDNLPLKNESINCCIYSLSLMAKSLGKILLEAKRILKTNGSLLIVEVTSRFDGKEKRWTNQMMSIGFKQKSTDTLPPNGYFTFFHFVKQDSNLDYKNRDLRIQLKPCQYKAR